MKDVVSRLFGGDPLPLFEHLICEQGLSRDEIQRLRDMLDQQEEEQDEPDEA